MWISEPTPVISSTKVRESGSSRSPNSTCSAFTGIQSYRCSSVVRCSGDAPRACSNSNRPTTNAATTVRQPSRCPQASVRRPPRNSTRAPNAGNASSSQASPPTPVAGATSEPTARINSVLMPPPRPGSYTRSVLLVLEQVRVVHRGGPTGAEDGHDDGQADHHFGGRDHHHEERHDLAVQPAVDPGEGDQGEVHRVQHQLDAHEHHDGVAAHQHPDRADGEQQRGQEQVISRGHRWFSPVSSGFVSAVSVARPPVSACASWVGSSGSSTGADSMSSDSDSGAIEPSGSSAGVATELAVAKTPGPGSGEIRACSPRSRASTVARWPRLAAALDCEKASSMAPSAAVMSSAEVSSNGNRYWVNTSRPMPPTLPPALELAPASPTGATSPSAPASAPTSSTTNARPSTAPASRWPRSTSTTESELSLPTSISTNRNSIITAPV